MPAQTFTIGAHTLAFVITDPPGTPPLNTTPTYSVEIAFLTAPGSLTPSWQDVTAWVSEWDFERGRGHELDRFETGTARVRLDNRDRRFEPLYAAGPYYPNVMPLRRIRIRAVWTSVTYTLWSGYVQTWRPEYPSGTLDADVVAEAADAFSVLAAPTLTGVYPRQASGARIAAVLDAVGWPAADRDLATGLNEVRAVTLAGENALQHLQAVALAEGGYLYPGPDGKVVFRDRASRVRRPITTHVTLGEMGGTEQLYARLDLEYDVAHLYNEVRATRATDVDGDEPADLAAVDAASVAAYYRRTYDLGALEVAEDGQAARATEVLLGRYKAPQLRARSIALDPRCSPAVLWPHALARTIGDRIVLRKRPVGGGAALEQTSTIERVALAHGVRDDYWSIEWSVSPADTQTYWQMGDASYGALGSTTRLWY